MTNRLYRSRKNRVFGGVASGLADYLNIDPILIRIIFVISTFFNGIGFLTYIILWIVVPEEPLNFAGFNQPSSKPNDENKSDEKNEDSSYSTENPEMDQQFQQQFAQKKSSDNGRIIGGSILIGIGILFLSDSFFPFFDLIDLFPLILVGVGAGIIINSIRK